MKKENEPKTKENSLNQLKSSLIDGQKLDLKAMRKIRGGEGDNNGGGEIIITPPKPA